MKRFLSILLAAIITAALLAGCKAKETPAPTATPPETAANGEKVKTGLAVISSISKSTDAGEKDGLAQVDSSIFAVTVGADGKITACVIDAAQTQVNFGKSGQITTPLDSEFKTKNKLGGGYGMKGASSIGKEWNEQAAAFAAYVVGKTIEEVRGIAVDESGHASGSDLSSSVTISIGGFIDGLEKAVASAADMGASAADKLSLGVVTNIANSKNAGAEGGMVQVYSTYAVTTTNAAGVITSCLIDASQSNVNFDASGKITSDLAAAPKTKNEIGDAYGMKGASSIGKEWYEQAAAFARYVTGKTAAEVSGIAVDGTDHATDTDIIASVTVSIGDFKAALAKAAA